jgi:hypothetical protein
MYIESPGDGYLARVDSAGRLFTKSDCSGRTVTTTRGTYNTTSVALVAAAVSDCCSVVIQNQGAVPLRIAMEATNPVGGDYEIAAGQTFVLPFPYAGEIRGEGVGGNGSFVTFQAKQAS